MRDLSAEKGKGDEREREGGEQILRRIHFLHLKNKNLNIGIKYTKLKTFTLKKKINMHVCYYHYYLKGSTICMASCNFSPTNNEF